MVLVVLAVAWGTVLVFWLRSKSQGAFSDSVGLFHRHLRVLERTAPNTFTPANRMRGPVAMPAPLSSIAGSPTIPMARPTLAQRGTAPRPRLAAVPPLSVSRRRQIRRRRRDVLFVLASLTLITLVLAAGTGSHLMLVAQLGSDAALVAYVALLVRLRNLAAERDMKLRVLHRPARSVHYGVPTGYGDLALRRVAN